jgi:hypothetical protein
MYSGPRHYLPQEWFSKAVVAAHSKDGSWGRDAVINPKIWRLVDERILWTMDAVRDRYGTIIMNDYLWGGNNQYRGYRPPIELLHKTDYCRKNIVRTKFSSLTSQHCNGRAADSKSRKVTAEEVRADIRKNPDARIWRFVTTVEDNISWLHLDCRNWNRNASGIMFFDPNG